MQKENDMNNNMTTFDFANDIWTVSKNCGGGKRSADYEVKLSIADEPKEPNKGRRVTITIRNNAFELLKEYSRVSVSSFSKLGQKDVILFRATTSNKKSASTYALSVAKDAPNVINIQFTPSKEDAAIYDEWVGCYTLKPIGVALFLIQREERTV